MKCEICGKDCSDRGIGTHVKNQHNMTPQIYYDTYFGKHTRPVDGKETIFRSIHKGYLTYCSIRCSNLDNNHFNAFRDNNPQKDPQIKQKTIKTVFDRYGVINPYQIQEVKEKCIKNNHTNEALEKRNKSLYNNIKQFCKENNCITFEEAMKLNPCNGWWSEVTFIIYKKWRKFVSINDLDIIKNYKPNYNRSKNELKLYQLICDSIHDEVISSDRQVISPYELDIYIPNRHIAIEYNGVYYYCIENGTSKDYHLNKSLLCREKGIRLIHIYDFENFDEQAKLIIDLLNGVDNFNKHDFNKNNLIGNIPEPILIFDDSRLHVYGAGKLY